MSNKSVINVLNKLNDELRQQEANALVLKATHKAVKKFLNSPKNGEFAQAATKAVEQCIVTEHTTDSDRAWTLSYSRALEKIERDFALAMRKSDLFVKVTGQNRKHEGTKAFRKALNEIENHSEQCVFMELT